MPMFPWRFILILSPSEKCMYPGVYTRVNTVTPKQRLPRAIYPKYNTDFLVIE